MCYNFCFLRLLISLFSLIVSLSVIESLCTPEHSFEFHLYYFEVVGQCEKTKCDIHFLAHVESSEDDLYYDNGDDSNIDQLLKPSRNLKHTFDKDVDEIKLVVQFIDEDTVSSEKEAREMFKKSHAGIKPTSEGDAVYEHNLSFETTTNRSCEIERDSALLRHGVLRSSSNLKIKHPKAITYNYCVMIKRIDCTATTTTASTNTTSSSTTATTSIKTTASASSYRATNGKMLSENLQSKRLARTTSKFSSMSGRMHISSPDDTSIETSESSSNDSSAKLVEKKDGRNDLVTVGLGVVLFVAVCICVALIIYIHMDRKKDIEYAKKKVPKKDEKKAAGLIRMPNAVRPYYNGH